MLPNDQSSKVSSSNVSQVKQKGIFFIILVWLISIIFGLYPGSTELNNFVFLSLTILFSIILIVWMLINKIKDGSITLRYSGLEAIFFMFILLTLITSWIRKTSFTGIDSLYLTFGPAVMFTLGMVYFLIVNFVKSNKIISYLIYIIIGVLFIGIIIFCLQLSLVIKINPNLKGYLGNVWIPGQFILPLSYISLVMGLSLLFWLFLRDKVDLWMWGGYFVSIVFCVFWGFIFACSSEGLQNSLTFTKVIMFVVPTTVFFIAIYLNRKLFFKSNLKIGLLIAFCIVTVTSSYFMYINRKSLNIDSNFMVPIISLSESWNVAPKAISDNVGTFLIGNGPYNDQIFFLKYRTLSYTGRGLIFNSFFWIGPAFNSILIAYGILGITAFLILLYVMFRRFIWILCLKSKNEDVLLPKVLSLSSLIFISLFFIIPAPLGYSLLVIIFLGLTLASLYNSVISSEKLITFNSSVTITEESQNSNTVKMGYIVFIVPLLVLSLLGVSTVKSLVGEIFYYKAFSQYNRTQTENFNYISNALKYRSDSKYYSLLSTWLYYQTVNALKEDSGKSDTEKSQLISKLLDAADRTVILNPNKYEYWVLRGDIYSALNNVSKGYYSQTILDSYTNAVKLNPYDIDSNVRLGDFLSSAGYVQDAISVYSTLIREYPGYTLAGNFKIALAYINGGDKDKGINILNQLKEQLKKAATNQIISEDDANSMISQIDSTIESVQNQKDSSNSTDTK